MDFFGSTPSFEADEILGFSDFLRESRDYYRAIGEYKRFEFLYPDDERIPDVLLKIASCEQARGKYDRAIQAYNSFLVNSEEGDSLAYLARFRIGECYRLQYDYEKVRKTLQPMLEKDELPPPLRFKIWHRLGWCRLQERKFDSAKEIFCSMRTESEAKGFEEEVRLAELLADGAQAAKDLRSKSAWLAGGLSAVIPGSGQIYLGRHGDAVFSFLTIATLAILSSYNLRRDNHLTGVILGCLASGFYLGNIYGAAATSLLINRQRQAAYLQELDQIYRLSALGAIDDF